MLTVWTKHLKTEKEKQGFSEYLQRSKPILERLQQILKEDEDGLNQSEIGVKTYDVSNWDYLQAHKNGYRQCLDRMKKLTTLDQKDIK